MKGRVLFIAMLFLLPLFSLAQKISYSDVLKENSRDMDFEIVGKISGNILVFKNVSSRYAISIYQGDMELKEKVDLDFIPSKAFNVDFVVYPDFFYLIYQYQKRGVVYCMAAKIDGNVKKLNEPVLLDTTQVGAFGDNKIYNVVASEDKQKIMIFKIQKKDDRFNFATLLYDNQLQPIHKSRQIMDYNERKDVLSDFFVDNEGTFVFAKSIKSSSRDDIGTLDLVTKPAMQDTFTYRVLPLKKTYIDEVKIKVDNVNKRYVLSSFYYGERRGNITGIYASVWDTKGDSIYTSVFNPLPDSVRSIAKEKGGLKYAFNDYFIRNLILKKDGGYLLVAEDFSAQSTGNNQWNRWDYLYNSPFSNPYYYNFYSPYYGGYYRPYNSFNNYYNNRYYYYNILVQSIDNKGVTEWSNIIHKEQFADITDNYLSYATFNTGTGIHFLFNNSDKRNPLLIDNVVAGDGSLTRNPSLKSYDKGYEFMIRYAKQTGARQMIVPCSYRQQICFAKIDF
ncbi:hypothetical protein BH11BAC5_BH11BAC5_36280 [soil metagenome]